MPYSQQRTAAATLILVAALTLLVAAACGPARAQVASQITPGSFAPPLQGGLGGGLAIGQSPGLDTPAGADKLFVTLRGVTVEGGFPQLAGDAAAVRARLMGSRVSGADIFAAARDLEAAYARAGYVLVRVTLPQQKLANGSDLKLLVIDGFIERVDTSRLPDPIRRRIDSLTAPLVGQHGIMLRDLERRILLAGDVPGTVLRSTLAAGSTLGATVLVIEANYQPVNGILTADNSLPSALGRFQVGVGADLNSVLGTGELVYLRATGDPVGGTGGFFADHPRNRILAAGFIAPLGPSGLTFNLEGTLARTAPSAAASLPGSTDQFRRLSTRLRYPWIRARNKNFATQLIFEAEDEQDNLFLAPVSLPLFLDRVRVLRVANEADYLVPTFGPTQGPLAGKFGGGSITATLTPSVRPRTCWARARRPNASPVLPLSLQGADATFAKLDGSLGYAQALAEHLTASAAPFARRRPRSAPRWYARSRSGWPAPAHCRPSTSARCRATAALSVGGNSLPPSRCRPARCRSLIGPTSAWCSRPTCSLPRASCSCKTRRRWSLGIFGRPRSVPGCASAAARPALSNGSLLLEYARQARSDGVRDDNRFNLVTALRF